MSDKETEQQVSERFSAADSDVIFRSCDNVLFQVHRNNLTTHSEGFAPPYGTPLSQGELVPLSESADVLELLFQYIYPQRTPDLRKVRFDVLAGLAEAVEKYQVYAAMDICYIHMGVAIPHHPLQVLDYAVRHRVLGLVDKVEDKYLLSSPQEAFKCLTIPVYVVWTLYYAQWQAALKYAHTFEQWPSSGGCQKSNPNCNIWHFYAKVSHRLGGNPYSLLNLDYVFQLKAKSCTVCQTTRDNWRSRVEKKLKQLPKFSTFL